MMQVTVAEAKTQLSSLLDAVEAGQAVVITRRSNLPLLFSDRDFRPYVEHLGLEVA